MTTTKETLRRFCCLHTLFYLHLCISINLFKAIRSNQSQWRVPILSSFLCSSSSSSIYRHSVLGCRHGIPFGLLFCSVYACGLSCFCFILRPVSLPSLTAYHVIQQLAASIIRATKSMNLSHSFIQPRTGIR